MADVSTIGRTRRADRIVTERVRRLQRQIGEDVSRARLDLGASKAAVAAAAGIDRAFYGRIEAGTAMPSLETLAAIGYALGGESTFRLYRGTGATVTDRWQAPMIEGLLGVLDPTWSPHLEVAVWRPARGVIDLVLERRGLLVAGEVQSTIGRLEQQLRWIGQKVESLGSSSLVGDAPAPPASKLLVLRSTTTTRSIAREFERSLTVAYPARTRDAVASIRDGAPWPGDAVVWMRIERGVASLLDGPPHGVLLGR
jgi:transcriptional regulator with XRE-family HTH domain